MLVSAWESRREKAAEGQKVRKLGQACRSLLMFIFTHYKPKVGRDY